MTTVERLVRPRAMAAVLAALLLATLVPLAAPSVASPTEGEYRRLRGPERVETAAVVARDGWPQGADTVLLARADLFPDALAGAYLAGAQARGGSPILLSPGNVVPETTTAALTQLGARRVILLGGRVALSQNVEDQLRARGLEVRRVGGLNRFDTARLVSEAPGQQAGTLPGTDGRLKRTAILASGENFADALASGPLSFGGRLPILLTARTRLNVETRAALGNPALGIQQVIIAGGTAAVSDDVANAVRGLGIEVRRIRGAERTETARRLAEFTIQMLGWTIGDGGRHEVNVATGQNFPDALALAPRAGRNRSVILLSQTRDLLGRHTEEFIASQCAGLRTVVIAGGTAAVSDAAAERAAELARCLVAMQFLWVSDWHAQLDPLSATVGSQSNVAVGGAAHIATYWAADRAAFAGRSITLTGGDAFGASPPLSNYFEERPAVLAQRMMGFDVDTFGNHNFDRGINHLQQMINLAGAPAGQHPGQPFQYVSANLRNRDQNLTGVKDYEIFDVAGVRVAVIGITNPEAPELVFPGSFGTIEVTDPVEAANRAREAARADGATVFVVVTHMGATRTDSQGNPQGPLIDLANRLNGFHIIFGDHTDMQVETVINGQLVVENRSKGLTYGRTQLTIDRRDASIVARTNTFVTPLSEEVTPDPAIAAMLAPFRDELAAVFDTPIGVASDRFPRGGSPAVERVGEAAIGNLVADAIRAPYGTQLAFTNGGGLRAPIPSSYQPQDTSLRRTTPGYAAGPPYDVVVGDAYEVLPFGNQVVTRTVTGQQLWQVLEHGVAAMPSANGRFPQISGFRFTFDATFPAGSRVLSVELSDGTPIPPDPATTYTLATNDFVNAGGDGYTMLADGEGTTQDLMANDLVDYIRTQGTITPTVEGRITQVG